MARAREPDRDKAYELYKEGLKLIEIANQLNLPEGTVRSWKSRYKWDDRNNATLQKNKRNAAKKRGTQPFSKSKKRSGNPNPENQFTKRNKAAEKHGFFSKYLPEETLEIMKEIQEKNPLDMLWENIVIQYTAIVRAQRIMYVTEKDEMIKEVKKKKEYSTDNGGGSETEWEFQFAWDRQATFLKAQSRAMGELRNMIKQYDELLKSGFATEEQKLRIEKLKTEVDTLKGGGSGNSQDSINDFIKATTMPQEEIKAMFEGEDDENIQE